MNNRELLLGVVHVPHRYGVGQRQRGIVGQHVAEESHVDFIRFGTINQHQSRRGIHDDATQQMQAAQYLLSGKVSIGDDPDQQWGDHASNRTDRICPAEVFRTKPNRTQVIRRRDVPRSPDEKLQEHHDRQADPNPHRDFLLVSVFLQTLDHADIR